MSPRVTVASVARSSLAGLLAAAVGLVTAVVVTAPAAADIAPADRHTDPTVTADALPTVQVDGVVWAQTVVGDTVYAAGEFTTARPAGAAAGTSTTPRANLLAFDIRTGELDLTWAPGVNGPAYAIEASPDGSRIYVGGDFTSINGTARNRFAVLDRATGSLVTTFTGGANAPVRAIAVSESAVYIGGNFNTVAGASRYRLASFDAQTGALRSWRVSAQSSQVEALVLSPDGSRLIVGGRFETLGGQPALGSGAVSTATAAVLPWAANKVVTNYGFDAGITSLDTDGTYVYGTAFGFLTSGQGWGNLEGAFAADPMTGEVVWVSDCKGDSYSLYANPGGDHVYVAAHPHTCSTIGSFPEVSPRRHYYAIAYSKDVASTITPNTVSNYYDWQGTPAPAVRTWFPELTQGTFTGQTQAGWSVTGNDEYVVYGGEFPRVNGVGQQGLVRFARTGTAPGDEGPRLSGTTIAPTGTAKAAGTVQLSWPANHDRDNELLTYRVLRDSGSTPVYSTRRPAVPWQLPRFSFTDTGLVAGRNYTYRVDVVDSTGNTVSSSSIVQRAGSSGTMSTYAATVLGDNPSAYWRLGETSGGLGDWTGFSDATAGTQVTRGVTGAIAGDSDRAAQFTGSSSSRVYESTRETGQNQLSVEAWFRTTSTAGGKIVGFGSAASTSNSGSYDRHLYMTADGRLVWGVYPAAPRTVASTAAYNDGGWHHVVGTLGADGLRLYVDGAEVAADPLVTSGQYSSGYWRIGGDTLGTWPDAAGSNFVGSVDEVAVYGYQLTEDRVFVHHGLGLTGVVPNVVPTAAFTAEGGELAATVDASDAVDPDGSLSSYEWTFGDGTTGTGPALTHTYAAPGTYTVTLTVTDDDGATATASRQVVVEPLNQSPSAAFTVTTTGLAVDLDGSSSDDPDGEVAARSWDLGDGTTSSGSTATHTYASAGTYTVTLTVTDDDGATATTSQDVTVAPLPDGLLVADGFERTVTSGWDVADLGGSWTTTAGAASVASGKGVLAVAAGGTSGARLAEVSGTQMTTRATTTWDRRPSGAGGASLLRGRITPGGEYRLKISYASNGTVSARLVRSGATGAETALTPAQTIGGLTYGPGVPVHARLAVIGTNPTTLQAAVWGASQTEPTTWQLQVTDSTSGLQVPGHVGLAVSATSSASNGPFTVRVDDLTSIGPGGVSEVPNKAPVPAFTVTTDDLDLAVDAAGSTDPDGTVTAWAWSFGDGATATGRTAAHTYAEGGTYTVALTVTDDDGATTTATQQVTVAPPPPTVVASDTFTRVLSDGFGTADVGGAWVTSAGVTRTDGTDGLVTLAAANASASMRLPGATGVDTTTSVTTAWDRRPNGSGGWALVRGRITSAGEYRLRVSFRSNGSVAAWFARTNAAGTETALTTAQTITGLTYAAGTEVRASLAVTGTSPTTLQGKVWVASAAEPDWQMTTTDATTGLQVAGHTGLAAVVSSSTTNGPATVRFDDYAVLGPPEVPNLAPAAAFTATVADLGVVLDGRGSADPDGTVVGHAWSFGDGATATGTTAEHTYATPGTYTVTLTVTDDDGATGVTTEEVTVTAPPVDQPPTAAFTATPTGLTVTVDGTTSSDPDGTVVDHAWSFGDGATGAGPTASHTYGAAGTYTVTLTVTDDDGATATATREVTVAVPAVVLASDLFDRTVTSGWGTADLGGAWVATSGAAAVSGGAGVLTAATAGAAPSARLPDVSSTSHAVAADLSLDKRPNGSGAWLLLRGRITSAGEYRLRVGVSSGGAVTAWLVRTTSAGAETQLTSPTSVPGLSVSAGTPLHLRLEVVGQGTTTLRAKVWGGSQVEPTTWTATATDSTAGLQVAGHTGVALILSGSASNAPVAARLDTFAVEER